MLKKLLSGSLILALTATVCFAQKDKDKKTYELIYKDVQVLKQQILKLEENLNAHTQEIKSNRARLEEVLTQIKNTQARQASLKEELKTLPTQYRVLLEKLEEMSLQLIKITEELLVLKQSSRLQAGVAEKPAQEEKPRPETTAKKLPSRELPQKKAELPQLALSPQEVYNMAYADYLKGNFELAIDGFKIYIDHFPESPLADNAQYWIGECYFSQEKYQEAIEEFNQLILKFPESDQTPSAYLKKGISLTNLGKKEEALATYKLLISKYPLAEETKLAQEKIKELSSRK
ncbi:MAG: tol-pal system protein YbgF [Candidatus Aminicenantales bacterium]